MGFKNFHDAMLYAITNVPTKLFNSTEGARTNVIFTCTDDDYGYASVEQFALDGRVPMHPYTFGLSAVRLRGAYKYTDFVVQFMSMEFAAEVYSAMRRLLIRTGGVIQFEDSMQLHIVLHHRFDAAKTIPACWGFNSIFSACNEANDRLNATLSEAKMVVRNVDLVFHYRNDPERVYATYEINARDYRFGPTATFPEHELR